MSIPIIASEAVPEDEIWFVNLNQINPIYVKPQKKEKTEDEKHKDRIIEYFIDLLKDKEKVNG